MLTLWHFVGVRMRGVTLIELMVTIAVSAILLTIGVPSFNDMLQRNRASAEVNSWLSHLAFARSEAIKRGKVVALCATDESVAVDSPGKECGSDWSKGVMTFVDVNRNLAYDYDASCDAAKKLKGLCDEILKVMDAPKAAVSLTKPDGSTTYSLGYDMSGSATSGAPNEIISYTLTMTWPHSTKTLTMTPAGRVRKE
jgi:prepilin-type N-terminal cleavage/methylation domain-containing protein